MAASSEEVLASGSPDFDRAREMLADGRDDEALDWFEIASSSASDPAVRASACAFAAGILLGRGRPFEVPAWADMLRLAGGSGALADLLEASSHLQLDDLPAARALLETIGTPSDPFFPCSATVANLVRAHVLYLEGDIDEARRDVMDIFAADPTSPDIWDAFAQLCAETDFDPTDVVDTLPEDLVLNTLAVLRNSAPAGVDRIVDLIWQRAPGDPRVLAFVPSFAARLDSLRAMEWSARMRAAGMGRTCPLVARAEDIRVDAPERVRAAALLYASFGDKRGRESLELAVPALADEELGAALAEVWELAPGLTDSLVVAGASTARRSLCLAAGLFAGGSETEAYSVLVHGLALDDADGLTTDDVVYLLPVAALEGLACAAEAHGDEDVAGILEAVAVVAGSQG